MTRRKLFGIPHARYMPLSQPLPNNSWTSGGTCLFTFLRGASQGKWLKLGPFKMWPDSAFETIMWRTSLHDRGPGQSNIYGALFPVHAAVRFSQRTQFQRIFWWRKNVFIHPFYDTAAGYLQLIYYNDGTWLPSQRKRNPAFLPPHWLFAARGGDG